MQKINWNIFIVSLFLFLGGCSGVSNEVSTADTSKEDPSSVSESTAESDKSAAVDSEDLSKEEAEESSQKENTSDEASIKDETENEITEDRNGKTSDHSSTPSEAPAIQDTATAKDQEKAVSLVKEYLRDRNELIEDEDHFVQYDGTIKNYIIVRYSTLVSGHSSTNGRYAVNLNADEVKDITAAADFNDLFN
jgi:hypothetical protein